MLDRLKNFLLLLYCVWPVMNVI